VTRSRGAVQIDGEAEHLFERSIGAGAVLASGAGTMDVQFGEGSALTLGPRSTLRIEQFDSAGIELSIDGQVDVEVTRRAPGQRFVVRAGAQSVEVRGTQFRVEHHADQTRVRCQHGMVMVREGARSTNVAAGQKVAVQTGQAMPAASPLEDADQLELAMATPYRVPWAEGLSAASARLELVASPKRRLRLDGVELGEGSTVVRVLRGRHLVEASHEGGPFRHAGWAVVNAQVTSLRFEAGDNDASGSEGQRQRRAELNAALDHAKLARCVRPMAKQGVGGTFVRIELAVDRDGVIGYLNITDTDLPAEIAECVRAVVADIAFRSGAAATISQRVAL
jgi:hypothetical protein